MRWLAIILIGTGKFGLLCYILVLFFNKIDWCHE